MTHVRVCIDSEVVLDSDLDEWVATPPDYFKDLMNPNAKPEPWQKAIMVAVADAALTGQATNIEVTTGTDRWSMEVMTT